MESILGAHARLLREAGHDVVVVAGRGDAVVVPEADSRHPEVERLTAQLAAGRHSWQAFDGVRARLAARLAKVLGDRDLVIAHNVMTMPLNLPLTAALLEAGRPLLAWTHDLAAADPRYRAFCRPGEPYRLIAAAQPGVGYVAVSKTRAKDLAGAFGIPLRRVAVVPNGIDEAAFLGLGTRTRELAAGAGFARADPLILVPVRITPRKRLDLALEAAALLRRDLPGLRLVVSGPLGPHAAANRAHQAQLAALRARLRLEQAVVFCHEHPGPEGEHPVDGTVIAELYRLADAVLLPSESEGFGLPVLEAALARTPVVCADLPTLRETGGGALTTFPAAGGPAAVAEALRRALAERPTRFRRRVLDHYAWEAIRPRLNAAVEAAVTGSGGSQ